MFSERSWTSSYFFSLNYMNNILLEEQEMEQYGCQIHHIILN